jgi:hypothetical protein
MLLQDLIDPEHLRRFRQALYNLQEFDILGLSWEIDKDNRVISPYNLTESVDRWGDLGFIDDWYLVRTTEKKQDWSPSLSTTRSVYSKRRKPLASFYSVGHRIRERNYIESGSKLPGRRKVTTVSPWNGFIESYLKERRRKRLGESTRYQPTNQDVESVLLASASFVTSRKRQVLSDLGSFSKLL